MPAYARPFSEKREETCSFGGGGPERLESKEKGNRLKGDVTVEEHEKKIGENQIGEGRSQDNINRVQLVLSSQHFS